jgi:hypothetical protein
MTMNVSSTNLPNITGGNTLVGNSTAIKSQIVQEGEALVNIK